MNLKNTKKYKYIIKGFMLESIILPLTSFIAATASSLFSKIANPIFSFSCKSEGKFS